MKIYFATNNQNKVKEINEVVKKHFSILSLTDLGCDEEIPEDQNTIEGNSQQKAQYVFDNYGVNCFADDTGLEVEALNGEPGVYSARYAGKESNAENNMQLLLRNMEGIANRQARFKTVITLILNGEKFCFEGIVNGTIRNELSGKEGFGYDPIFEPEGYDITFAEMLLEEKNKISHRAKATQKLIDFLKKQSL